MRNFISANLITFSLGSDQYGITRKEIANSEEIEILLRNYTRTNVSDIRYVEATDVALTKATVTDGQQIRVGDTVYDILYTIPSPRLNTIFLKKVC